MNKISMDNFRKLCGLELKDILIQQESNSYEKNRAIMSERKNTFIPRDLTVNIQAPVVNFINLIL